MRWKAFLVVYAAEVLYGASAVILAIGAVRGTNWVWIAGCGLMTAVSGWSVLTSRRAHECSRRVGRNRERREVLASLMEAQDRGMSPDEWVQTYLDKCLADASAGRGN